MVLPGTLAYSLVAFGAQLLAGRRIAQLFIDSREAEILNLATHFLNIVVGSSFLLALVLIYRNAIQGLGFSRISMVAGLMELVGRTFVAFVLVGTMGFNGACFANPAAWICADAVLLPIYLIIVKRLQAQTKQTDV